MEFRYKHPSSGEIKIVSWDDEKIQETLEDYLRDDLTCDCQPVGETNVIECNCEDYLCDFEIEDVKNQVTITTLTQRVKELEAEREWISVDDRLPEENEPVSIIYKGHICGVNEGVARMLRLSRHVGEDAPADNRWFFIPSFGHEVKPTHWRTQRSELIAEYFRSKTP